MSVVKFDSFGGEFPSVSPRALPGGAAQVNQNLYARTSEFRPLKTDLTVASCSNNTLTMHRFARKADGSFNSDTSTGWIASTADRNYVKGQINDERTERTYYTLNDGSARPRVVDVTGQDRVLGVPRPVQPTCTVNATDEVTATEGDAFLYGEFAEAVKTAIINSTSMTEPAGRYSGTTIYAGPYTANNLYFPSSSPVPTSYWNLWGRVTDARAASLGLDQARLGTISSGGYTYVHLTALPYSYRPNSTTLTTSLQAIQSPDGTGAFMTTTMINTLITQLNAWLDPSNISKSARDGLDTTAKRFADVLANTTTQASLTKPTEPSRPTVNEWDYDYTTDNYTRNAAWTTYDAAMVTYRSDLAAYNTRLSQITDTADTVNNTLAQLQADAVAYTRQMESLATAAWEKATKNTDMIKSFIDSQGGLGSFNLTTVERVIDNRFYAVTFVTDWGEESQPSPASAMLEVDQNDTVTIARPASSSGETYASRNIVKWRIYRSATGNDLTAFQFVSEVPIASSTITDNTKQEALGESLATATWAEPPYRMDAEYDGYPKPVVGSNPYMRGLVGMPNGIMAGFLDNTIAFCEPYIPYAWPETYQVVIEYPVIGLGVFGQTLFVGTTANPYFITGADSASMIAQKLDTNQACVSRRSIVSVQGGVLYASPDGLCLAEPNGVRVVSSSHYTREDWQALSPATMFGVEHEGVVYMFYTGGCITFDVAGGKLGRINLTATAAFVDRTTDTLFVADGTSIKAVFGGTTRRTGLWKSARGVLPAQTAFGWIKVTGDQSASSPVTVRWYADGNLVQTLTITDTNPKRLVPGRYLEHEIEIESTARITQLMMAGDTAELRAV